MKAFKFIVFLLLILIIGSCTYIAVQPNNYEVVRSRTIDAAPALIYDYVNDFRTWESWSSWIEKKPDTKITYPEQTKGVGGSYSWEDDDGVGNMKTIAATPYESIEQSMQFDNYEPSKVTWSFAPTTDGKTNVTWNMKGDKVPFGFKLYAVFSGGFDKMIGPDFERGLEKLDSLIVESTKKYEITINGITEYGGGFYLYKTTNAKDSNISQKMAEQYGSLMSYVTQNNIAIAGMPLTVYNEMNTENGTVIMSNGLPVNQKIEVSEDSDISCGYLPKTSVLKTTLTGNYTNLADAWDVALKYIADNNLVQSEEKPFEIYTNDPGEFPNPAHWITEIYIPLKINE
ncbi:MAG: transcription activator effector-binding protein [Bacteroidetes bacterium]|nr:MAG: transcription activator effector-binding protein [Bacteroidota bacterium]